MKVEIKLLDLAPVCDCSLRFVTISVLIPVVFVSYGSLMFCLFLTMCVQYIPFTACCLPPPLNLQSHPPTASFSRK